MGHTDTLGTLEHPIRHANYVPERSRDPTYLSTQFNFQIVYGPLGGFVSALLRREENRESFVSGM